MKNWCPPQGYIEKRYNYTYKLTFKYDKRYYYYGVHSTNTTPEFDGYYGSGSNIKAMRKKFGKDCFIKEILEFFPTRKDALLSEDKLVPTEILQDEFCLNKIQGGGTFDTTGMKLSEAEKSKISKRFKGKKRSKESIEKMIATRQLRGNDKHMPETIEKLKQINLGRVPIYKNNEMKRVYLKEIEQYLKDGWMRGYPADRNEKVSQAKMGDKNPMFGKKASEDRIRKMLETKTKNGTNKHSKETIAKLTQLNRIKAKDKTISEKISKALIGKNTWTKGTKFIHKPDGTTKNIPQDKLQDFLNDGWLLGRPKKNI